MVRRRDPSPFGQNAVVKPAPPEVAPPDEGLQRWRALVAYDGAPFHGFAANPGVATVAGTLQDALARVLGRPIELDCAGRTDRGVHAWGQVVSFDAPIDVDPLALRRSLNRLCAPSIVVRDLSGASDRFDARFSACSRTYRYQVLNRDVPDPFLRHTTWHLPHELDLQAMNTAGAHLLGEHDFSSFCRKKLVHVDGEEIAASLVRDVLSLEWVSQPDDLMVCWITASAFCHQMVRAITGTLVDVGRGRIGPDMLPDILAARDRRAAGALAPARGLTLWSVQY